jgi:uncharacterized short protein YbdD (DUF466 family)
MNGVKDLLRYFWSGLRSVSGDDAYERYLEHHRRSHPDSQPLEQADFQVAELDRRWSQANRCC